MHQAFGFVYPATGAEHQLYAAWCMPFVPSDHILLAYSSLEIGGVTTLSPVYATGGAYVRWTPLSVLQLQAEVVGIGIWPLKFTTGAGHFDRASYNDDWFSASLPGSAASSSYGMTVKLGATLRGAVDIGDHELIVLNSFVGEYWAMRSETGFYYNLRNDLILKARDWVVNNQAIVLYGIPLRDRMTFRVGLADEFTWGPNAKTSLNLAGVMMAMNFSKVGPWARDFMPVLRVGWRTAHPYRTGTFHILAAFTVDYDLAKKRR